MLPLFRRLLGVIATATQAELRQQVQYLKLENEILRKRITGPIRVTPQEKSLLVKFAKPLGKAMRDVVSIVQPSTLLQWVRDSKKTKPRKVSGRKPGRPRTREDIRRLILRMAKENDWGYARIRGELLKLGIKIGHGTIVNILREARMPTSPERSRVTWQEFIQTHARTLWACDYLRQRVLTWRGWRDAYALAFVNVVTRRAIITPTTLQPTRGWAADQVKAFNRQAKEANVPCKVLTRDRDSKFGKEFAVALREQRIQPVRLPIRAPNLNAHVERFIQSVQDECLHKFIVVGTKHMDYLLREYTVHYNTERPHMGIGLRVPMKRKRSTSPQESHDRLRKRRGETGPIMLVDERGRSRKSPRLALRVADPGGAGAGRVVCRVRLGGVLKHYERAA
ncbi:MAG: integrase core domain-containing protein [Phycisphaerae bacterium]|jgi:putative transposase